MEEQKKIIRLFVIDNHETIITSGFHQLFRPGRDLIEIAGSAINVHTALNSDEIRICDIIILDLWIPDEKPLENVRMLNERHPDKPLLIYSTEDSPEWIRKMMVSGVKGFVNKDASRHDIKSAIERIASGGSWFTLPLGNTSKAEQSDEKLWIEYPLSPIQLKILTFLLEGKTHKEIADILNSNSDKIEKTLVSLRNRFNAKTTVELVKILLEKTLI